MITKDPIGKLKNDWALEKNLSRDKKKANITFEIRWDSACYYAHTKKHLNDLQGAYSTHKCVCKERKYTRADIM